MANILIIDDDTMICKTLAQIFSDMGHAVHQKHTLSDGIRQAESMDTDLVFLDVRLPDGNGLEQLPVIQALPSAPEVIIITAFAGPDGAELALKNNAWDYIQKPASLDAVTMALTRALEYRKEKLESKSSVLLNRDGIIGKSPEIDSCLRQVARAANSNANILISGETGTGKELFARAIHTNSRRSDANFVVIDCAALPDNLTESILFGYEKGAFTGAVKSDQGLIKHADGGTLFLDEIGELPMSIQKTFLRVLQERRFRPVGAKKEVKSNFRLVSASNRELNEMVDSGQFREDLLFRLRSININLPPLRKRKNDIRELAVDYLMMLCDSYKIGIKGFSPEFLDIMSSYSWPGNVRELHSVIEYAIAESISEQTLFPKHLPKHIRIQVARSRFEKTGSEKTISKENAKFSDDFPRWQNFRKNLISDGEKRYLVELVSRAGGDIKKACRISGLSQPRIYELLRKYQIPTR